MSQHRLQFSGSYCLILNSLRPRQNGRLFADDTFKRIFLHENITISTKNSLKFVPKRLINNIPALVQIMVWCRSGDKPLSEPMMLSSPTHICVTRSQWVNCNDSIFHQHGIMNIAVNEIHRDMWSIDCVSHKFILNNAGCQLANEVAQVSRTWCFLTKPYKFKLCERTKGWYLNSSVCSWCWWRSGIMSET